MRLLVIHQNFPGQFGHMVQAWAQRPDWDVKALARDTAPGLPGFGGLWRYRLARAPKPEQHPYLRQMEAATLHGQAVARALLELKRRGWRPDAILAHPGWGETLYVKDVFPDTRLVHLCEWYYAADGGDLGFDPEFPVNLDDRARIRTWNALHTLNLVNCDAAVSPTQWQRSQHPKEFLHKIAVQHEGVATEELEHDPEAAIRLPNGKVLKAGDPVVTYVARNLEPYRGFHVFMRALQRIQQLNRSCHAVIVGGDEVSYGARPKEAANWREKMLGEVRLDPERTHFVGPISRAHYLRVLQVSAAHVYLTYPFVLSWSMLEAMGCGALVIGSQTAPVQEVLRSGINGTLVPFFEERALVDRVCEALDAPEAMRRLRMTAASTVRGAYAQAAGVAGYGKLLTPLEGKERDVQANPRELNETAFVE